MGEHDCLLAGCVGKKYDGSSFTCNRCLRPFFYDCLDSRNEVKNLMNMISNVTTKTPMKLISKIKLIFGNESIFETICPKCKSNGNFTDHLNQWKENAEADYKKNIDESNIEIDRLNKKCENLELINANLNQKIIDLETGKSDINMDSMTNEEGTTQIDDIYNKINNKLKCEITEVLKDMEQRFQNQFDEMKRNMIDHVSPKRKRVIFQPNNDMVMTPKTSRINNTQLKPPDKTENNDIESSDGIYRIHVSRFHINTTELDIQKHILDNTNISNVDTFKIHKLVSQREENKSKYVSFKITTLKREDYMKIINENIWLPDFQARNYNDSNVQTKSKKTINHINTTPKWKNSRVDRRNTQMRNQNQGELQSQFANGREIYNRNRTQIQLKSGKSTPKTYVKRDPYGPLYMVPNGIIQYPHQQIPQFGQINSNFPHFWIPTQPPNQVMNQSSQPQVNQMQQTNPQIK